MSSLKKRHPRVALVHDYLREYGGAERVLEALHEIYPDAPVYVAFKDERAMGIQWQKFADWDIRQTWIKNIPFYKQLYSPLRVLAAWAFESLDLSEFDLVISSSNAYFAKAVLVPNGKHFCYCHTPPRSLYGYSTMTDWKKNPVIRIIGTLINHYTRVIDFKVAQRVDYFIANSRETQKRIEKFYRRESVVINPPVAVPTKLPTQLPAKTKTDRYYLYVNRLAFAKHPELAVQVCTKLGKTLKVVGTGKMMAQLQHLAGPTIEFLAAVPDTELAKLYQGATALLYPVEDEDFGIVPVEAMAYGVPVIAHRSGGPQETIINGKTGIFFDELSVAGLSQAIKKFEQTSFNRSQLHRQAKKFAVASFKQKIKALVATDY